MISLKELRDANIARHKEWSKNAKLSLSYRGNELGGEVGEAQNVIKKIEREKLGMVGSRASKDDLADELADIIICTDLIAMDLGIDLGAVVQRKFNKTSAKYDLRTRIHKKISNVKFKEGDILRYSHNGPSALLLVNEISKDHGGAGNTRYYGKQCCGGVIAAYEKDCQIATSSDLKIWNKNEHWRKK